MELLEFENIENENEENNDSRSNPASGPKKSKLTNVIPLSILYSSFCFGYKMQEPYNSWKWGVLLFLTIVLFSSHNSKFNYQVTSAFSSVVYCLIWKVSTKVVLWFMSRWCFVWLTYLCKALSVLIQWTKIDELKTILYDKKNLQEDKIFNVVFIFFQNTFIMYLNSDLFWR